MKKPVIVDVPEKMQKFYGAGTMLHPELEMVEEVIKKVPSGKIATIGSICQQLASQYGTHVTCPMRTGAAIKKITETQNDEVPYWRVIRNNHLLINSKFLDVSGAALEKEGFELNYTPKGEIKVSFIPDQEFLFDK